MKNKWIATLLSVMFICSLTVPVRAADPLELHMESAVSADGELEIYCNSNSEETLQKDNFSVMLGNTALPVKDVKQFANADMGASYVFLVDVSGSIKSAQLQAIKDTITLMCDKLTDKDNVGIFTIGDEIYAQPFVSGHDAVQDEIDKIETSDENTNLYDSISKSLAYLHTQENCKDKKVLVVFSDGEEDSFNGITLDEVTNNIKDSHVPIYTAAMLGANPTDTHVETAKVLGSFARLSAGGRNYIHTLADADSKTIADDIMDSVMKSYILTADLSDFRSDGGDMTLRLDLTVSGTGKTSDSYTISTIGLSAAPTPEPTPEPTPSPSPTPTASPAPTEKPVPSASPVQTPVPGPTQNLSPILLIICIAAALLVIGIILFIILRRRKKTVPPPTAPLEKSTTYAPSPRSNVPLPPAGKPRISMRLTKMGRLEEQVFRAEFAGEIVIGRDLKTGLCFKNDELLSSRHCSISYETDGIILRDLGSTNGTFVNGVPIKDRYKLENDDVILIGSMELRINWESL